MLDLAGESALVGEAVRQAVDEVLTSQHFIGGPSLERLETAIRRRVGVAHAVAVSSGTDALLCSLMALAIGPGDEVIVPAFTFFATAGVVARVGARPVFVDIDPETFNLDPAAVEAAITDRTRAIIAVHLFGQCAEMDAINAIAQACGLVVIEDAAQALGAGYRGRPAGSLAAAACLSFYPTKNLGGFGEGGMILTDDEAFATTARSLRNHGEIRRYVHERVGGNFRLDTLKAAVLLAKLDHFDEFTRLRRRNAASYTRLLAGAPVVTPRPEDHHEPVYHQYSILADRRDELVEFLQARGVSTGIYYPVGLHLQPCFVSLGYSPGSLPVTEEVCDRILSVPCHPMLSEADLEFVASCVHAFYGTSGPAGGGLAEVGD